MKKGYPVLCMALAACLSVSLFTACSAISTSDEPAPAPAAQPSESAPAASESKKPLNELKIGLSMQTLGGAYFATQESTFKELCGGMGITLFSADAQGDMSKQQSDVEDLISKGCDVIVINPKDPKGAVATTQACTAAGIPVFIMDNSIDPSADYVSMIQSDNYELGNLVGIDVAGHFGSEKIKIGLLSGNQGNALGVSRRMGTVKGITETQLAASNKSNFEILTQGWGNWNQEGGLSAAEDMLMAAPDINCIIAENDDMALGALQAVQAANRSDIIIAGVDGQKEMYRMIKEGGQILATGRNDPAECADLTLQTILKWLDGESVQKLVYLEPVSVNAKNIDQYYDPNSKF